MKIGKFYQIDRYFWFMFPTKTVAEAVSQIRVPNCKTIPWSIASHYEWQFKCQVDVLEVESFIVALEEVGVFRKILTTDGKVGWIFFDNCFADCFCEVNQ